jgi:stage III sporulation protein SpoIIIAA
MTRCAINPHQEYMGDDLEAMLNVLPDFLQPSLRQRADLPQLLEIVLDLGRVPKARFLDMEVSLSPTEVTDKAINDIVDRLGDFGDDNRAGIPRTLHRISAMRSRQGKIVGLTCRVGRAVFGTVRIIHDLVFTGQSILLLGRPGVGKTTMLREVARVLSDDMHRRVVIVDTSNEIAGDGDIPHPAIGDARRMQVTTPSLQHSVMIEAVENHMPEVIVIDEMGTELEAAAARSIAERGVQLIATAHGNTLNNVIMNPTLRDLVGGVQTVILGDDEAKRRRTQKSVLERKGPPTFDIVVEIQSWNRVAIHHQVSLAVDAMLRGFAVDPEIRSIDSHGQVEKVQSYTDFQHDEDKAIPTVSYSTTKIHPYGVNRGTLEQVVKEIGIPITMVNNLNEADILLTTKSHYRKRAAPLKTAEKEGKPVFVLRKNTASQMEQFLHTLAQDITTNSPINLASVEAEAAVRKVEDGAHAVALSPQSAYIRRLQHQVAKIHQLSSSSGGFGHERRVTIFKRQV